MWSGFPALIAKVFRSQRNRVNIALFAALTQAGVPFHFVSSSLALKMCAKLNCPESPMIQLVTQSYNFGSSVPVRNQNWWFSNLLDCKSQNWLHLNILVLWFYTIHAFAMDKRGGHPSAGTSSSSTQGRTNAWATPFNKPQSQSSVRPSSAPTAMASSSIIKKVSDNPQMSLNPQPTGAIDSAFISSSEDDSESGGEGETRGRDVEKLESIIMADYPSSENMDDTGMFFRLGFYNVEFSHHMHAITTISSSLDST